MGKIRNFRHGDNHVFVHFKAGRTLCNGGQFMPVFPEQFTFLLVFGKGGIDIFIVAHKSENFFDAVVKERLVVAVHLHNDNRNGVAFVAWRFSFIFNSLYVFYVKFFQCGNTHIIAFIAYSVAKLHNFIDKFCRWFHASAKEFKGKHTGIFWLIMQGEHSINNQPVHTFFLHTGQAAEHFIGYVFAKAGETDFIAAKFNHAAKSAGVIVTNFKGGDFRFQNFVVRVADTLNADEFAGRGDHTP